MADDDYNSVQQPNGSYLAQAQQPGAGNYGAQQTPASLYSAQGKQTQTSGAKAAVASTKTYHLPDPETNWTANLARYPHVSTLPLYIKGKAPSYDQIQQQGVENCYLAATLAALANTSAGRKHITKMITPHKGPIITICRKYDMQTVGPEQRIASNRWFTVAFKGKSVDVSDVLYHDDSDRDPNLRYMTTPNGDRALWGAIIEVAYASLKGGYDNISASKGTTVEKFLDEFAAIKWSILNPASDKAAIKKACAGAGKRATFIASKSTGTKILIGWHGYAVLRLSGVNVKLWDPLYAKVQQIKFTDLLTEVQAVVSVS